MAYFRSKDTSSELMAGMMENLNKMKKQAQEEMMQSQILETLRNQQSPLAKELLDIVKGQGVDFSKDKPLEGKSFDAEKIATLFNMPLDYEMVKYFVEELKNQGAFVSKLPDYTWYNAKTYTPQEGVVDFNRPGTGKEQDGVVTFEEDSKVTPESYKDWESLLNTRL